MIPIRLVKKIELGPRQMTFGFDDSNSLDLDFVYAFIEKEYQAQGPVALHRIADTHALASRIPEPLDIVQAVFWLAEALKIHFYVGDRPISTFQAKQALLKDADSRIDIVTNQPVDQSRFARAKDAAKFFLPALPKDMDNTPFPELLPTSLNPGATGLPKTRAATQGNRMFRGKP